jgi:hypothetical protein
MSSNLQNCNPHDLSVHTRPVCLDLASTLVLRFCSVYISYAHALSCALVNT